MRMLICYSSVFFLFFCFFSEYFRVILSYIFGVALALHTFTHSKKKRGGKGKGEGVVFQRKENIEHIGLRNLFSDEIN